MSIELTGLLCNIAMFIIVIALSQRLREERRRRKEAEQALSHEKDIRETWRELYENERKKLARLSGGGIDAAIDVLRDPKAAYQKD